VVRLHQGEDEANENLCADWIVLAMEKDTCGFDLFERAFITSAAKMLPSYHKFYLAYLVQKQDPSVIVALKAALPAADDELIQSQYTVVQLTSDNSLIAEPHASSPARRGPVFAPILAGFDERNVS